ncbi:hypothetical protein [Rhizobium ruizarguesonis]|uniref:hypothetical protein n=1 Tax=Rhizobium ruizarguesonis TaxID=2081791 RepID=UPI001030C075|nr:hypothetical protein [Rhizobium ruizarguesonis]TBY64430.1 hypothetical protein E0H46_24685 [Rhizobium leguminosarum bv. viciae]TAW55660.1 hypothetical protein ELI17_04595 [Rhizobium ruizarguesonis]TBC77287.1 hypothetical protein ELH30_04615 [Rhizobium ruizarguesonis]TBC82126.1 hypothetical protein ELH28_04625 [Rhizobium ruizarguesonis]TBD46420.1 hypothetical protein ELH17_04640 [Rhizobium ruizarguesonis]
MEDETTALEGGQQWDLAKVGARWQQELERAQRYFKSWHDRCVKIEKIYLDQQSDQTNAAKRRFPMLWANTSVLQPAVYARVPQPVVERRFKDAQPVARIASELVERNLAYMGDEADIDSIMRAVRDDFLLCARGTVWLRYEADFEPLDMGVQPSDAPANGGLPEGLLGGLPAGLLGGGMGEDGGAPPEAISDERVCIDYVHWSDFLHSPARRWKDVTWVARRVPMTDEEMEKRFGPDAMTSLQAQAAGSNKGSNQTERAENEGKTHVWEIWCKSENYTVWIADGAPVALEVSEPPLDLTHFWPCPRPAYGTMSTSSLIPVPDYVYYQQQCDEIDLLTKRVNKLTDQLRLKVFYPSGDGAISPAIEKAMRPENDTVMVPIPEWAAFTDKGGSKAIVTLPIDEVQKVIIACIQARKQLIEDVYQITGISDIVRGDTQASETATAQRIKSQWGSIRIRDRQSELARFARDIIRLAGEIICDQFQPETLMLVSGIKLPSMAEKQQVQMQMQQMQMAAQQAAARAQQMGQPAPPPPQMPPQLEQMMQQPTIDEVVQLLRNDSIRGFQIDIETDSTIEPDEDAEKQRRMEFVQMIGGFLQQAGAMAQQNPMLVPVMVETLLFAARGFRAGRQLESTLEQVGAQLSEAATAPKPPPEPPSEQVIKLKTAQVKAGAEQRKAELGVAQAEIEHRAVVEQARGEAAAQALQQFQAQQPPINDWG